MEEPRRQRPDLDQAEDAGDDDSAGFEFPQVPEYIEPSLVREAQEWKNLDEFDALVLLEEKIGLEAEVQRVPMGSAMWGFTYTNRELGKCRIHLNSRLPEMWQRFAFLHEVHHLLHDSRGCYFWAQTHARMSSFEYQADHFAWAVFLSEEQEEQGEPWE